MNYLPIAQNNLNSKSKLKDQDKLKNQDKQYLQRSLIELNKCYQQKINLLQKQLQKQKQLSQKLSQQKASLLHNHQIQTTHYEQQIQKLLIKLNTLLQTFNQQQQQTFQTISQQNNQINLLKLQNSLLKQEKFKQNMNIQQIVAKYVGEIDRLKHQLRELRDYDGYQHEIDQHSLSQQNYEDIYHQDDIQSVQQKQSINQTLNNIHQHQYILSNQQETEQNSVLQQLNSNNRHNQVVQTNITSIKQNFTIKLDQNGGQNSIPL